MRHTKIKVIQIERNIEFLLGYFSIVAIYLFIYLFIIIIIVVVVVVVIVVVIIIYGRKFSLIPNEDNTK